VRAGQGPIKPGESDTVEVFIDTSGKRGRIAKAVQVTSNDPERPVVVLVLKADIQTAAPPPAPATSNTPRSTPE
jgi:hypothetical protein